jgi:hypothetical protein
MAEAVEPLGITASQTEAFTGTNGLENVLFASTLRQEAFALNQGEVSEPILVEDGLLVAQVTERSPATTPMTAATREEIQQAVKTQASSFLFQQWQQYLLDSAGFTKNRPGTEAEEDVASEEEGEESEEGA